MERKALPIGIDNFEKLIRDGYYYVDKTSFIKELLDKKGEVNLFTRPRRFGKTLCVSMLRSFFEIGYDARPLFQGLEIMDAGDQYLAHMGKYPVISLSLKSGKQPTFAMAKESIQDEIIKEFNRHDMVKYSGRLLENEVNRFVEIQNGTASEVQYTKSLEFLSTCLRKCYGNTVVILIDEYDVPLENAYFCGYYEEMAGFIRSLFEAALKTNPNLAFAVITGCLRITKESIFTGLNNLNTISILNLEYGEYFGFTYEEVSHMLEAYEVADKEQVVREWYDGYCFGETNVYNPWSVINFVQAVSADHEAFPAPYWANTSSNNIIRTLVRQADMTVKAEIEGLIAGETIEKPVHEEITYGDIGQSRDNLWNFLFFTGYLKQVSRRMDGESQLITMQIPNAEVRYIYRNTIISWFRDMVQTHDFSGLYQGLLDGDEVAVQRDIAGLLVKSISYMDSREAFYHGFLLGLLGGMKDYLVQSNRESGDGRYDIMVRSLEVSQAPVILELKVSDSFKGMERKSEEALEQIEQKGYDRWLWQEGYSSVVHCGIAFYKKQCRVRMRKKELEESED